MTEAANEQLVAAFEAADIDAAGQASVLEVLRIIELHESPEPVSQTVALFVCHRLLNSCYDRQPKLPRTNAPNG